MKALQKEVNLRGDSKETELRKRAITKDEGQKTNEKKKLR